MRGIPNKIGTKQDIENLCRDLPVGRAAAMLKVLDKGERKRLGLTLKEGKALAGELKERKRREDAADKKTAGLRAEKARVEERAKFLLMEIEGLREGIRRAAEARLSLPRLEAQYKAAAGKLGELNKVNKVEIPPARAEAAIRTDIGEIRARLLSTRDAEEQLLPKERECDLYVAELTVRRGLEKQLADMRPAEAIEADIEKIEEEIRKLRAAYDEHNHLKSTLAGLGTELAYALDAEKLNARRVEAAKSANEALNEHRRLNIIAGTREPLEDAVRDRLACVDGMKTRLGEIKSELETDDEHAPDKIH